MADPKMQALVDALRAGYVPADSPVGPVTIERRVPGLPPPRLSSDDYRKEQFLRSLPAHLPQVRERPQGVAMQRQLALAAALRGGRPAPSLM